MGGAIGLPWGIRKENGYFEARPGSSIGTIDVSGHSPNDSLPEVSLLPTYSGFDGRLVMLAADEGVRAFVVTAYDDGYIPEEAANAIKKVIEEYGIPVVAAGYNP
ncbi:hypothetical protein RAB80_016922 [Fusarium oxysporum f. sp. vasinfectum]|uniref:asparaginase n=1 Tax=Fusarium oxysporum f. sp. vasinfectum 25433 TaxID=1089449 RepID=X0KG71_FUSOX|nr:hypothetical protein FOTG_18989 [Fusarium oxysporum f. sp. vasinfectum 25433]KAK2667731.1 hypothetical protein RAB80_016922 [Fusarium oxysporum f. sp. vasinfectum]KAK2923029.1 hypothetical protein FoTM2_017271 [Fusarium oxysporum f. sp. vasinfectum]